MGFHPTVMALTTALWAGPETRKIKEPKIFDRWGELAFEIYDFLPNEVNFGWDGYFRGKPMNIPAYHQGRLCLIGDAGMVAQPFTGSGVFKGYTNIKDLLEAFNSYETLEVALAHWSRAQVRIGNRLLALGEQMEQAFIWNSLDLARADAATTEVWWRQAVRFPEEFTYEAEEK